MRVLSAFVSALAVTSMSSAASAGGFYLSDIGTRGMGRAGAFVAAPDSVLAIHYNPAGLSLLRGLNAEASVTFVNSSLEFNRKCPCLIDRSDAATAAATDAALEDSFEPVTSPTTLVIPFVGASYGIEAFDFTVGLAAWGPNSGRHDYGSVTTTDKPSFRNRALEQPGRYSGMAMKNLEANFALAVAAQPIPGLRLGFSILGFQSGNDQTLHLWTNSDLFGATAEAEDPTLDAPVTFKFKESFALNWAVGGSYEIIEGLSIGTSFRGKRDVRTSGTIDAQLPARVIQEDLPLEVIGRNVEVEVSTAPIWRTGVQYQMKGLFAAEAAFVFEGWHVHDDVVIRPQDIQVSINGVEQPLGAIKAERGWQDTWSLRLGGEFNMFDPMVNIVGGYFYEPTGIPSTTLDPSRIDLDKHGFSLGARTSWYGFTLDVSAMFVALSSTEVRDSEKPLTAVLPTGLEELQTYVGNGDYSGSYFLLSASLSFALDPLLGTL